MIDDFSGSSERPASEPAKTEPPKNDTPAPAPVDGGMPHSMAMEEHAKKHKPSKKPRRSLKQWFLSLPKKKRIMVVSAAVLIIGSLIAFLLYVFVFAQKPDSDTPTIDTQQLESTTEPSELTGIQVLPKMNDRPVMGIMIENSPDARPQSGLIDAGVVFEAVAEGGITRFLALYQEDQPNRIGPIRSARPYFIDWLTPFKATYAHVGGSPKALQLIQRQGIRDLDQFSNPQYYQRISERFSPHNMYSSMKQLDAARKARNYKAEPFKSFVRAEEDDPAKKPTARRINFNISSGLYNVEYRYMKKTNNYRRIMGGEPHKDEKSGRQIKAKTVIAMVMPKGIANDGQHTTYGTIGSGRAFIFQDGKRIVANWKKKRRKSQIVFINGKGETIKLNPGRTWITAVAAPSEVQSTK